MAMPHEGVACRGRTPPAHSRRLAWSLTNYRSRDAEQACWMAQLGANRTIRFAAYDQSRFGVFGIRDHSRPCDDTLAQL
jgi:hypothetical protein